MSKNNENMLVPKLRFPEFLNNGEWKTNTLDEIAEFLKGKGISKADVEEKGKLPCIRYGELYTHYREVIKEIKSFTNLSEDDLVLSEEDDVIIPSSGETKEDIATASCVKIKGVALGGDLNILRSKLDGEFLAYYISHGVKKSISKIAQGDAVVHLYSTQLKKISIKIPPKKEEQQKIASCLSSLDAVITAENQKLNVLKEYKKGLLQNLFPQEGETVPNIRFSEFNEGWKKVKLKDVSLYFNGGSYENDVKGEGKYELITLKSINTSGKLVNSKRYVDIEVPTLTKGTLVMILSEQAPGLIGMTAIIPTDNKYVLNQRVAEIRPNQKVESYFLSMAINRNQIYFSKKGAGMKVQNISKPNVENYEFFLPEILEQQKIADCLSSLDELVSAQNQKLEELQLHKKGLLQGLFPM